MKENKVPLKKVKHFFRDRMGVEASFFQKEKIFPILEHERVLLDFPAF